MSQLKSYSNTQVALSKTQESLDKLLAAHGIQANRWTHFAEVGAKPGSVVFEFEWRKTPEKLPLGFKIAVDYKGEGGPQGGQKGTTREQAGRALYWHVKNLFDAVDFGIVDLEQAFMPYLLLPDGDTAYERWAPRFEELLEKAEMPPLLTEGRP